MEKHSIIIQTAFLGDALLSIPLIKNFKQKFPDHKLTFLCRKGLGELFESLKLLDHVVEVDKKNKQQFQQSLNALKKQKWEYVLCPHQSLRSHSIVFKLRAKLKVGFKNNFNFFIFDKSIQRPMQLPDALRQLSLLTLIDNEFKNYFDSIKDKYNNLYTQTPVDFKNQLQIPKELSMYVEPNDVDISKFNIQKNAIFIAPGSVWPTKRWTLKGFSELISFLEQQQVYLIGSPNEQSICDELEKLHPQVINLCGKTSLLELAKLLSTAKCLFSNDSGTMHMASMVNCPTVSLFGPTTLDLGYRPWSNNSLVVQKTLSCRPCGKHGHKKCPIGTHECMKSISGLEVYQQALNHKILTDSPSH